MMEEFGMRLDESVFSEIDLAIQDYVEHVEKYGAPLDLDDCMEFIRHETGIGYDELYANEQDIEDMLMTHASMHPEKHELI